MSSLRAATIRLAHENPELQSLLLPLLAKDAKKADEDEDDDEDEKEGKFERGEDVPLSKMPKKLQDNANNPPPSVQKVKDKIKAKKGSADYELLIEAAKLAAGDAALADKLLPVLAKHLEADSAVPGDEHNPSDDRANAMGWDAGRTDNAGDTNADYPVTTAADKALLAETIKLASTSPELEEKLLPAIREATLLPLEEGLRKEAAKWEGLPKGWTSESRKKFWASLTGDAEHKVTVCIGKMQDKLGAKGDEGKKRAGAFCASLRDRVEGKGWRSERSAAEAKLAVDDENLSLDEVRSLCPGCAEKMASYNMTSVKASVLRRAIALQDVKKN